MAESCGNSRNTIYSLSSCWVWKLYHNLPHFGVCFHPLPPRWLIHMGLTLTSLLDLWLPRQVPPTDIKVTRKERLGVSSRTLCQLPQINCVPLPKSQLLSIHPLHTANPPMRAVTAPSPPSSGERRLPQFLG